MEVLGRTVVDDWRLDYLTGSHPSGFAYCHFKSKFQLLLKVNFSFLFLRCRRSENTSTNSVRKYCVELCGVILNYLLKAFFRLDMENNFALILSNITKSPKGIEKFALS